MKFDIHYLFSAKYAKWIIISLITLFSLLIIYEYATLFSPVVPAAPASADTKVEISKNQDTPNYILDSTLFGNYVPDNLSEDNVKKSMLNVTIVGILLANKSADSQVIIRSSSGEEKTYNIGDKIPGGATIKRIKAEGIFVERDGSIESLSLPKDDLTFEPAAKPLKEE